MSVASVNNLNVLAWYTAEKYQNHRKEYAYGKVFPFVVELGYLPPFQIPGETINEVTKFDIIKFSDLSETAVLSQLPAVGFSIQNFDDYDLAIYPATVAFTGTWEPGRYYARFQDGTNTWYSDVFVMSNSLSGCLKLEYWHNENFVYPGGHIQYNYPYKNFVYIATDIGKPEYKKEEVISKRDGKEFPLKQTTWKEYKFEFKSPEYMADALSRVCQHDNVVITLNDVVFTVDKFDIEVDWQKNGDIAIIEATFRTDTETVINARGYNTVDYDAASCGCLPNETISAKAAISVGFIGYSQGWYYDTDGTTQINFVSGDYILADLTGGGTYQLQQWDGNSFIGYTPHGDFPDVCISATQDYYFENGFYYVQTSITSATVTGTDTWNLQGKTFDNISVEIWTKTAGGSATLVTTGTAADFNGSGIEFTSVGANAVQVRPATINCSDFDNSEWFLLGSAGIGWMTIGTTNQIG
jgi:hypothetical protein